MPVLQEHVLRLMGRLQRLAGGEDPAASLGAQRHARQVLRWKTSG